MLLRYVYEVCVIVFIVRQSVAQRKTSLTEDVVIGVHFGREELRYALYENGNLFIIPNREGSYNTRIIINFDNYGRILIGKAAKYNTNSYNAITNLQNIIGKTFQQIKLMPLYPFNYNIIEKYNKPYLNISYENGSFEMTVEEAFSLFFKEIKLNSEIFLNSNISKIVLSVPDHFEGDQERAIIAAANRGGLTVLKAIKDSNAVIYGYVLNEIEEEKNILTINSGKESTEFVLNTVENNNIEIVGKVVASNISESLFDNELEKYLKLLYENRNSEVEWSYKSGKELRNKIKEVRLALSNVYEVDFYWNDINKDVYYVDRITRAKFDEVLYEPINKVLVTITNLLSSLEIRRSDISHVLLSGNIFKSTKLLSAIKNYFFGLELRIEKDLEEIIVEGAAIVAFNIREKSLRNGIVLVNTVDLNMGIEVSNGIFHVIVPKGSPIPLKISENFTLTFDNQDKVNIKVLEGEKSSARGNNFLGEINFECVSNGLRNFILFNIDFEIDRDGRVIVTATNMDKASDNKYLIIDRNFATFEEQSSNHGIMDERALEMDRKIKKINQIRQEIETVAYEIKAYMKSEHMTFREMKSPIDYLILEQKVDETILWLESRSAGELEEVEEVKRRFESIIKPILARTYGE